MRSFEPVKKEFLKYNLDEPKMPRRATLTSVGYDFYSPIDVVINPNEMAMIWTNIKAKFNDDEGLILCVTSGMGKYGVTLSNSIGVIESDYYGNVGNDGNLGFRLFNLGKEPYIIKTGDKIGQGFFIKILRCENEIPPTEVRKGGFGSTNK